MFQRLLPPFQIEIVKTNRIERKAVSRRSDRRHEMRLITDGVGVNLQMKLLVGGFVLSNNSTV